jgi:hypothetical protein
MADGQHGDDDRPDGVRGARAIRTTTVTAVSIVAAVAAFASYRHMRAVALEHGEDAITAAALPLSVDGLIVAASMTMLADRRAGRGRGGLSYLMLALGACASLAANMLHAEPSIAARIIAGWPPLALLGSYELLMRQIHPDAAPRALPRLSIPGQRRPSAADPPTPQATAPAPTAAPPVPAPPVPAASPIDGAPAPVVSPQDTRPATASPTNGPHHAAPREAATEGAAGDAVAGGSAQAAASTGPAAPPSSEEPTGADDLARTIPLVTVQLGDDPATRSPVLEAPMDPAAKRAAIVRALDDAGGSATGAVEILATRGITVSRSWVYQVRRDTAPAPGGEAPSGITAVTLRGRRRGLAPDHLRASAAAAGG